MDSKSTTTPDVQKMLADNIQQLTNLSISTLKPMMESWLNNISAINNTVIKNGLPIINIPNLKIGNCAYCPPEESCPPHCIASITRNALEGERIVVPFMVKNDCNQTKTYRIGVRELNDENSAAAPSQPVLNKNAVTLDPGRSEKVLITVDLSDFKNGSTYSTEIVLREKDINQNICFTLVVDDPNGTVVIPQSEQQYRLKWQSWKDHYYCEKPTVNRTPGTNVLSIAGK